MRRERIEDFAVIDGIDRACEFIVTTGFLGSDPNDGTERAVTAIVAFHCGVDNNVVSWIRQEPGVGVFSHQ